MTCPERMITFENQLQKTKFGSKLLSYDIYNYFYILIGNKVEDIHSKNCILIDLSYPVTLFTFLHKYYINYFHFFLFIFSF